MAFRLIRVSALLRNPAIFQIQERNYAGRRGFIQDFVDKIKDEYNKDKKLKDNIKKFRDETSKIEKSEELQKVRDYYSKIESEIRTDTSDKLRKAYGSVRTKMSEELEELQKNEMVKKGMGEVGRAASKVSDTVTSTARHLSESDILLKAKEGVKLVEQELETDRGKMYRAPKILKTRAELAGKGEQREINPDDDTTGMVLHKDSQWMASWQNFKDNNAYMQKFFDLKTRFDESETVAARSAKFVTEKMSGLFGSVVSNSELQKVLNEITKSDPSFTQDSFLRFCQFDVIPNVIEAIIRGDLPVLEDWCYEAPFNVLAQPIRQAQQMGCIQDSKVLDIHNVDISAGKLMEQGPVLVISFSAQQISAVRNREGKVIEGDINKIYRVTHVWALCRDQNEFNPWAAWRIIDIAMMPSEQWI